MKALIAFALILTSCILSPEPKTLHEDHEIAPSCFHEDSTIWTDTTEVEHLSCKIDSLLPAP